MSELVAWLTKILDEDEADTRNLTIAGIESGWESWFESGTGIGDKTGYVVAYEVRMGAARRHIARHDPAAVLADIAAKRAIIDEYVARDNDVDLMLGPDNTRQRQWTGLQLAVRILVTAYADRPGYRDEWNPLRAHP